MPIVKGDTVRLKNKKETSIVRGVITNRWVLVSPPLDKIRLWNIEAVEVVKETQLDLQYHK